MRSQGISFEVLREVRVSTVDRTTVPILTYYSQTKGDWLMPILEDGDLRTQHSTIYVQIDNLDLEFNAHSARGYDISYLEFDIEIGDGYGQYTVDQLKNNLDDVIEEQARISAHRGWRVGLKGYRVDTIGFMNDDGDLSRLPQDWNYTRYREVTNG